MAIADLLSEINRDVWMPFRAAYASRNADAFIALNAEDVIRVEGNSGWVGGFEEYAARLREWFQWVVVQQGSLDLRFRFLERHVGTDAASERGVYRLALSHPETDERLWFGRFHTLSRKRAGVWRIVFDYDTDEDGTVNQQIYDQAVGMTEYATL